MTVSDKSAPGGGSMQLFEGRWESDVLHLSGELDLGTAVQLQALIGNRLDGRAAVTVDLEQLTFLDSTGIRALMAIANDASPGDVVLRSPQRNIRRVLDLVSFEQSLPNVRIE